MEGMNITYMSMLVGFVVVVISIIIIYLWKRRGSQLSTILLVGLSDSGKTALLAKLVNEGKIMRLNPYFICIPVHIYNIFFDALNKKTNPNSLEWVVRSAKSSNFSHSHLAINLALIEIPKITTGTRFGVSELTR